MQIIKAIAEIDAKRFLRVSWVAHVSFLILVTTAIIFLWPERMTAWMSALPALLAAVAIEWAAATGGSSLKRLTEAKEKKE